MLIKITSLQKKKKYGGQDERRKWGRKIDRLTILNSKVKKKKKLRF